MTLLDVHRLSKTYQIHHLERRVPAFQNLSFTLDSGEFKLIVGPNGAGKSTLLRCLYRAALPTEGVALYASKHGLLDLTRAHDVDIAFLRREEIGYVSQFLRPRPRQSALDVVLEGLPPGQRAGARDEAASLLSELGLKPELLPAYPSTFSGGEQQKVNLARALIRPPRLLLLDEPTASLDAGARTALSRRLSQLKRDGVALLGVFHHPADMAGLVDAEVMLSTGDEQETAGHSIPAREMIYVD